MLGQARSTQRRIPKRREDEEALRQDVVKVPYLATEIAIAPEVGSPSSRPGSSSRKPSLLRSSALAAASSSVATLEPTNSLSLHLDHLILDLQHLLNACPELPPLPLQS